MTKPQPFHGFIGQRKVVKNLKAQIAGSKRNGISLPNICLYGPAGMGKTELAKAAAVAANTKIHVFTATRETTIDILIAEVQSHEILLIDEAHALHAHTQEALYPYLEAANAINQMKSSIPVFSTILATDQPNRLTKPLRSRCSIEVFMEPYSSEELRLIITGFASKRKIALTPQATTLLAEASQGNPRKAGNTIRNLAGYGSLGDVIRITEPDVQQFLVDQGYDHLQRDSSQVRYLEVLKRQGTSVSLGSLALQLGLPAEFVSSAVEPFLIQKDWVEITPKGRRLTMLGDASIITKHEAASADAKPEDADDSASVLTSFDADDHRQVRQADVPEILDSGDQSAFEPLDADAIGVAFLRSINAN